MPFSHWLGYERSVKPGSHLCDKHNTSDISISISSRKKEHVPFFFVLMLMLMSLVLCLSHKCEPGFIRVAQGDTFLSASGTRRLIICP